MENIILTVHLIVALCLIGIVLVQRSEGGGLGVGGGGGGATSGRPAISALGKLTWVFGIAFVITSISLTVIAARNASSGSVLDGAVTSAPAGDAAPSGDALLPPTLPTTGDAPLAPPRIDE
ncbi:preprotein translocase subunit SecG [Litoreibacter albidus]|uniref:Protein-export membrane protein SecG n=1 Tax=Litoreibacter albidus TaxID=670155 RepID=A0A1H2S8E7_9RHOB|nr:preprotein translocase subunit SecG [Litoreibacter albidus]SDW27826.1 protein translocase subunit secG [Litoreibacter albidus]